MIKRKIIKTDDLENNKDNEMNDNMDNNQDRNVGKKEKNIKDKDSEEIKKIIKENLMKVYHSEDLANDIFDDILKNSLKEKMEEYIRAEGQKRIEEIFKISICERNQRVYENQLKEFKNVNFEVNFNINFNGYKIDNIIAEMRKQYHLNQNELSKMMNVSRPTVSSIENNENNISLENAFKLSRIFGKSIEELFFYNKDNKYDNDNNDDKCNIYDK